MERIIELRLVGKTPAQKIAETSKTIDWVRKKGKGTVERGVEVLVEIEKAIEEENNKLQKEEQEKMVGLDPTDGSKVNRASRLYKYASKDDEHIYREMDDLMKTMGSNHSFMNRLQENAAFEEEGDDGSSIGSSVWSEVRNARRNKHSDTAMFWSMPTSPGWGKADHLDDNAHRFESEEIKDITVTLRSCRKRVQNLLYRLAKSNSKKWLTKLRSDILKNDLKGVTKQLIREPKQEPEAHPFILVDEETPRGENGELNWRLARSSNEEREGTRQKHQDWTSTAGEEKNLHYMEDAEDEHGNKIFIVHPNTAPPDDEEL